MKKGDTLQKIAAHYGIKVRALMAAQRDRPNAAALKVGQVLIDAPSSRSGGGR